MNTDPAMKKVLKHKLVAILSLVSMATVTCGADGPLFTSNTTNRFRITGMSCDGCARGIASELKRAPGVVSVEVSFSNRLAVVAYDTNRISAANLKKVIVDAGYEAKLDKPGKARKR